MAEDEEAFAGGEVDFVVAVQVAAVVGTGGCR